jgi:hypothetical protein
MSNIHFNYSELRKDSKIKFNENIIVNPNIPRVYYELYGDCAEYMFNKDNFKGLEREEEEKRLNKLSKEIFKGLVKYIKIDNKTNLVKSSFSKA